MLTDGEVGMIIEDREILEKIKSLKQEFRKKEAPYLDISDHDFFSLILLMPGVSIALSNKSVSLREEHELNKKARRISKKSYFLKKDPVVSAMRFLIKSYKHWETPFLEVIRAAAEKFIYFDKLTDTATDVSTLDKRDFEIAIARAPFLFIRMLILFFRLDGKEDLQEDMKVSGEELETMRAIGSSIGFDKTVIFRKLMDNFAVK
ncbi:MAG TPA: hypothetical protein VI583_03100 [Cyclobacteriaceae bacterium]|nr:hypothetical protein [Cyclobacteriaceae bacterium]